MSSEILSQNDIDLLLGGAPGGAEDAAALPRPPREAVPYDFRRPHRVSKERLRTLEAMYERLVKSVEGWLLGRVRGGIELTLREVEQLSFGEFALSLPSPCCAFMLDVEDSGGQQGVIDFGQEFACFLVERFLGGRGEVTVLDRALTPIERAIVRIVGERIGLALTEVWEDYIELGLVLGSFESVPEILRSVSGDEPVLVARVDVSAAGATSTMGICLPFTVLDSFFADSGSHRRSSATGSEQERDLNRRLIEGNLRLTGVPIAARLPEFRIAMRTLTQLREGMVLETGIARDAEVQVVVAGETRYAGRAARMGRKLAVSIEASLRPDGEPAGTLLTNQGFE